MRLTERLTGCLVQPLGLQEEDWVRISDGREKGGTEGRREGEREDVA